MKTKSKFLISIIAIILGCVIMFMTVSFSYNTNKVGVISASTRTVEISQTAIDVQCIFDEFDDVKLTREGTTTYFEGYKPLEAEKLSEIDYISEDEFEELENCTVKYNFSYDSESNVVTIAASTKLADGSIEIDEIRGVGFINDDGEIDAVMNVDGEGILLSEMRSSGMIENCGWFSKLIKKIAVAVAVVAVVAVAVAAIVVTAGTAAPAVVAAGVGVSTTVIAGAVATAATIGTYATITALLAAGIALTAEVVDRYYPGCNATEEVVNNKKVVYANAWNSDTIKCIKDICQDQKNKKNPKIYFECRVNANYPNRVELNNPYDLNEMAVRIKSLGKSCVTEAKINAESVIKLAVPEYPVFEEYVGLHHFHACDIHHKDYNKNKDVKENPRLKINDQTLHSFWMN